MNENQDEDGLESNKEEEKSKLEKMGVSSTWNVLTSKDKKKKEEEKKPEFRGFK